MKTTKVQKDNGMEEKAPYKRIMTMTNTHKHGKRYSEKRTKTITNQSIQKMFDAIKRPRTNRACRFVDYHIHLLSNGDFHFNSRDGEGITMESFDVHEGDVFEVVKLPNGDWYFKARRP